MRKPVKKHAALLPADVNAALRQMIGVSRKLCTFADLEMRALTVGDMMKFAFTQKDKEKVAEEYANSAQEFSARINDFRMADKTLIAELERLQKDLKYKSEANNAIIRQIRDRSQANTKGTLFTAQEMGQRVKIHVKTKTANDMVLGAQG